METVAWAVEADLGGTIWNDISEDVVLADGLSLDYGIRNQGPLDLVASTGNARFTLDNSHLNSAGLLGYYTPGHVNCRAGWDEGSRIRISFTYGGTTYYKFVGWVSAVTPTFGIYRDRRVAVRAVDWMDQAAVQKIAQLAIESSKRIDQALATIVSAMPIPPRATSYAAGVETFDSVFNTDKDEKTTVMSLFQKLARNEYGRIYVKGDTVGGETLCFESRHTRPLNTTVLATFDNSMQDLKVAYDRSNVYNIVKARIYPLRIDAAATTVIATSQKKHPIGGGQSLTLTLEFRDPTTGDRISATDVVNPLVANTDYKFGSSEGTSSDLNAYLSMVVTLGGNSAKIVFSNTGSATGWLNLLQMRGKGIYPYDPQTIEKMEQASIDQRGELTLTVELEQHDTAAKGESFADYLRNKYGSPNMVLDSVKFLGNRSSALMTAAVACEIGSRFTLAEDMTGLDGDYFINAISLNLDAGGILWADWKGAPASVESLWIWDTSEWDMGDTWAF